MRTKSLVSDTGESLGTPPSSGRDQLVTRMLETLAMASLWVRTSTKLWLEISPKKTEERRRKRRQKKWRGLAAGLRTLDRLTISVSG